MKEGKIVAGQRGPRSWRGRVPLLAHLPPHVSWQADDPQCCPCPPLPGLGPDGEVTAPATPGVSQLLAVRPHYSTVR